MMTTATATVDAMMIIRGGAEEVESGGRDEGRGEAGMAAEVVEGGREEGKEGGK